MEAVSQTSHERFQQLKSLYEEQEPKVTSFESDLIKFHDRLNNQNKNLEEVLLYPDIDVLTSDYKKHESDFANLQGRAQPIFRLKTQLEDECQRFHKIEISEPVLQDISFVSPALGATLRTEYTAHQEDKDSLLNMCKMITGVYMRTQVHIQNIDTHTLLTFRQRITAVKNGTKGPSSVDNTRRKVARYIAGFNKTVAGYIAEVPDGPPPISSPRVEEQQ